MGESEADDSDEEHGESRIVGPGDDWGGLARKALEQFRPEQQVRLNWMSIIYGEGWYIFWYLLSGNFSCVSVRKTIFMELVSSLTFVAVLVHLVFCFRYVKLSTEVYNFWLAIKISPQQLSQVDVVQGLLSLLEI